VSVRVSDEDEDAFDRSDPVIADATSRVCRALWKNEGFRAADFVYGDLPATPSRAALDLFLRGRSWNASTNGTPNDTIRVSDRADEPANEHDLLALEVAGLRIFGEKSPHTAAVANVVLESSVPYVAARLRATNVLARNGGSLHRQPSAQPAPRLFACRAGQVRAVGKQDDQ
jgi:hypothetical protein